MTSNDASSTTSDWRFYGPAAQKPKDTAIQVLTPAQKIWTVLILCGFGGLLWFNVVFGLTMINAVFTTFYLVISAYKLYLIHLSLGGKAEMAFSREEISALSDAELPVYSVLVPLYRESESLPRLIKALSALDYPKDKLDIQLLLEEDDDETRAALKDVMLPGFIRVTEIPLTGPRTKPKACNYGLAQARGDYVVIYDAEDRPEPDQLKKAVLGFRSCGPNVVCLQAKLNFYNQRQNLLTRCFTTEYSMWFDLYLPGLDRLKAPIPLGGTSNHFVIEQLRKLCGWDPFNVTEDCDLGVRLAQHGYETKMIDSTTWEEACSHLGYWIRQRSRWTKGYIQTYLVHMRRPFRLARRLGMSRSLGFHMMIGGTPLCLLINPVYWFLTLVWFVFRPESLAALFPFPIILWALFCLIAGNFAFVYACLIAAYRRGYFDLVKYGLLAPAYWMLMSIGGWKGCAQLITRPSYWEKTKHGLDIAGAAKP